MDTGIVAAGGRSGQLSRHVLLAASFTYVAPDVLPSLTVSLLLQHQLLLQQQHTHQHAYNSWQGEIYCPDVSHVSLIWAIITNYHHSQCL